LRIPQWNQVPDAAPPKHEKNTQLKRDMGGVYKKTEVATNAVGQLAGREEPIDAVMFHHN
jgi:hypothetical protein